jgi:hypothetical protein
LTLAPQILWESAKSIQKLSMPSAVQCSPSTKLESGYPPNSSLLYIVHSGGQNRRLSPLSREPSIARTRLCTPIIQSTISIEICDFRSNAPATLSLSGNSINFLI